MMGKERIAACPHPAEIFTAEMEIQEVNFQDNRLENLQSKQVIGSACRVIHQGQIGTATGGVKTSTGQLIEKARHSARFGRNAAFHLPEPAGTNPVIVEHSPRHLSSLSIQDLQDAGQVLMDQLAGELPGWTVHLHLGTGAGRKQLQTTTGIDTTYIGHTAYVFAHIVNARDGDILELMNGREDLPVQPAAMAPMIRELTEWARASVKLADLVPGRYPVVCHPRMATGLMGVFEEALSGRLVHEGLSPLKDRIGERIFHPSVNIWDDPLCREMSGYWPLCDEGVPVTRCSLVTDGVLTSYLTDLDYAARLGQACSGHGRRLGSFQQSHAPSAEPSISTANLLMAPGDLDLQDMLGSISHGVFLVDSWDMESGNLLNGDISGTMHLAFLVRDGEITGRIKDMRISGNLYELLGSRLAGLSGNCPDTLFGHVRVPYLLMDDVSIA